MTQIKGWHRTDKLNGTTVWKHDTGIRIVLEPEGSGYNLILIDRHGVEDSDCRTYDTNREYLEKVSTRWQESYAKFLEETRSSEKK